MPKRQKEVQNDGDQLREKIHDLFDFCSMVMQALYFIRYIEVKI